MYASAWVLITWHQPLYHWSSTWRGHISSLTSPNGFACILHASSAHLAFGDAQHQSDLTGHPIQSLCHSLKPRPLGDSSVDFLTQPQTQSCSSGALSLSKQKTGTFALKMTFNDLQNLHFKQEFYKDFTASPFSDILNQQSSQQRISLCISESASCSCPMSQMRDPAFRKMKSTPTVAHWLLGQTVM